MLLLPRGAVDKVVHPAELLEDAEVGQENPVQWHLQNERGTDRLCEAGFLWNRMAFNPGLDQSSVSLARRGETWYEAGR